jgi:hypothetical protein
MGGNEGRPLIYSEIVESSQRAEHSSVYRAPEACLSILLPTVWGFSNFFELFL